MTYAQIALLLLTEAPGAIALMQKYLSQGVTPTIEDLNAEMAQLGADDANLAAAYARLFPGQQIPQ
jgi:hypothetical protein